MTPRVSLVAKKEWITLGCPDLGLKIVGKEKEQEIWATHPHGNPTVPHDARGPGTAPRRPIFLAASNQRYKAICFCL